jgi:predicted nucleic acid-binding protein
VLGNGHKANSVVLCDTNIFIHAFNGDAPTIEHLKQIGLTNILLSSVTVMELYQGMGNKNELAVMRKKLAFYDVVQIDRCISEKAIDLIVEFKLSHGLQIPDALIAATVVSYDLPLFTYNIKDFSFIPGINLSVKI